MNMREKREALENATDHNLLVELNLRVYMLERIVFTVAGVVGCSFVAGIVGLVWKGAHIP